MFSLLWKRRCFFVVCFGRGWTFTIMWWGYSPALDVLEEYESATESSADGGGDGAGGALAVLLVGCGDGRHQLRSLARRWRRGERARAARLTWHVAEPTLELAARHLLLQSVAFAPRHELGPRERARLYLELYGNTLLRARTATFLARRGAQLARLVADEELLRAQLSTTLDDMRHRERDSVQDVCLLWRAPPAGLSMAALWERRLRRVLGVRYDSREGVFDWDYHMRLRDLCGDAITLREYRHWRETGVAFAWAETSCSRPNASLLSWVERAHGSLRHQGYCGDIESAPYPAFGVECDDEDLLRSVNGMRPHTATDVSERNLMRLFHELQHSTPYVAPKEEDDGVSGGVVITELPDARDDWGAGEGSDAAGVEEDGEREDEGEDEDEGGAGRGERVARLDRVPPLACVPPPLSLTRLLPPDAILKYPAKPRFRGTFDVIILAQGLAHLLSPEVSALGREGALLLVEGKRYALSTRKKDVQEFAQTLAQKAKDSGCAPLRPFDPLKHDCAAFRVHHAGL